MGQTVLKFILIEFDKNWTRAGTVLYTAIDKAQLVVVVEGVTGVKEKGDKNRPLGEKRIITVNP